MSVYFHGNFGLNREYMAAVLKQSLKSPDASAEEIAAPFGYKAPFTARYRSWLNKTGLTTGSSAIKLTPIGKVVWAADPKLKKDTTQWLLHHVLTGDPERAEAWHFFASTFSPSHSEFSITDLQRALSRKLMPHHATHFGPNAPMVKVIARKIVQCYTLSEALGGLGMMSEPQKGKFRVNQVATTGPWTGPEELKSAY